MVIQSSQLADVCCREKKSRQFPEMLIRKNVNLQIWQVAVIIRLLDLIDIGSIWITEVKRGKIKFNFFSPIIINQLQHNYCKIPMNRLNQTFPTSRINVHSISRVNGRID